MNYTEISNDELAKAIALLVRPDWLSDRAVMIAILRALKITPQKVRKQLEKGVPAHKGPYIFNV